MTPRQRRRARRRQNRAYTGDATCPRCEHGWRQEFTGRFQTIACPGCGQMLGVGQKPPHEAVASTRIQKVA